jgi:hypothetical protein
MKRLFLRIFLPALFVASASVQAQAQREISREEYIATYAPLAIQHQKQYGIPASIKMAQGILESRHGNSDLSRRSNNHFGIKCKTTWQGDTVLYDDDAPQECFRRYNTVEESYRDHSEFLRSSARYSNLFELKPDDYKGWAHGLKASGYATATHYAVSLIKLIEDYDLYLLDEGEFPAYLAGVEPVTFLDIAPVYRTHDGIDIDNLTVSVYTAGGYVIYYRDGKRCILARQGDSFASIAGKLEISERKLRRYNKAKKDAALSSGDVVFIDRRGRLR